MADTVKNIRELKLVAGFVDGDEQTITLPDPKSTLKKTDIVPGNSLDNGTNLTLYAQKVLKGEKTGADFDAFKSAEIIETEITKLDLTSA